MKLYFGELQVPLIKTRKSLPTIVEGCQFLSCFGSWKSLSPLLPNRKCIRKGVCCGNTSISLPGGELCLSTVFYSVWCQKKKKVKKKVTEKCIKHITNRKFVPFKKILILY
uniref:Uncharacterized protein n=1 Tax=Anser brachyrhynchus TaxID=132585 RepID=A0A8B9BRM3_9AVES